MLTQSHKCHKIPAPKNDPPLSPKYFHAKKFVEDNMAPYNLHLHSETSHKGTTLFSPKVSFSHMEAATIMDLQKQASVFQPLKQALSEKESSAAESVYEDAQGNSYRRSQVLLGQGAFAHAHLLIQEIPHQNTSKYDSDAPNEVVVLKPKHTRPILIPQLRRKYHFYKLYHEQANLFLKKGSYRLIIPYIQGTSYRKLYHTISEPLQQINIALSAIEALKKLHALGYVFLDLHPGNIIFDAATNKSHLIDGDMIRLAQSKLTFRSRETERKDWCSPEYWQLSCEVNFSMDIYSLGYTINSIVVTPPDTLQNLLDRCQAKDPKQRPSLAELAQALHDMEAAYHLEAERNVSPLENWHISNSDKTYCQSDPPELTSPPPHFNGTSFEHQGKNEPQTQHGRPELSPNIFSGHIKLASYLETRSLHKKDDPDVADPGPAKCFKK